MSVMGNQGDVLQMKEIYMVEPTDPTERAAAIRICRLNCCRDPETGLPVEDRDLSRKMWDAEKSDLPYEKWIWMWNHGKAEWDPRFTGRDAKGTT
jgi:hypothetical protein